MRKYDSLEKLYQYWWIPTIFLLFTVAAIAMVPSMFTPAPSFITVKNNPVLTKKLIKQESQTRYTITMVYKDGCQYCESARETIATALAKHNTDVVEFNQINNLTDKGAFLLKKFNAKGVPLVIVTDNVTDTSHAFNDSDKKGIEELLNKYAFVNND